LIELFESRVRIFFTNRLKLSSLTLYPADEIGERYRLDLDLPVTCCLLLLPWVAVQVPLILGGGIETLRILMKKLFPFGETDRRCHSFRELS
jgi:hypothetical protein